MSSYITKEQAKSILPTGVHPEEYNLMLSAVKCLKPADVAPVVHGEWEPCWLIDSSVQHIKCSVCGFTVPFYERTVLNYCPNCGARMDGE